MSGTPLAHFLSHFLAPLRLRWQQLGLRERQLLGAAGLVILAAVVWTASLAPSLKLLKTHETQRSVLDRQLSDMRALQAQAQTLQAQPLINAAESARLLTQFTQQQLGKSATVTVNGDRATVTLQATPAQALAQWLAQARLQARSVPLEARLNSATTPAGTTWSGQLTLSMAGS